MYTYIYICTQFFIMYIHIQLIQKISESAGKEYQIEQALEKMEKEWEGKYYVYIHTYVCV
jgi:hypothetical protein